MNRNVNAIAGRLSLRPPQRQSLEILHRVTELVPPHKGVETDKALAAIRAEFPTVTDFEREFPSLCFALATGVGLFALFAAVSMAALSTGVGVTLAAGRVRSSFHRIAPVLGISSMAFGVWYALGALSLAPYYL